MNESGGASTSGAPSVLLTSIYQCSPEFLGELKLWIEQAGVAIPVNQLVGFAQFTAQQSTVDTSEVCNSVSFTDLATVGPQVTGLADGKYFVLYGATLDPAAATTGRLGISISGAVPATTRFIGSNGAEMQNGLFAELVTLTGGSSSNSIKLQYSLSVTGSNFRFRNLSVLRYA